MDNRQCLTISKIEMITLHLELSDLNPTTRETALCKRVKHLEGVLRQIQDDSKDNKATWTRCQEALYKTDGGI